MTCNDDDCESCNPLSYCELHDHHHKWYEFCYLCEDDLEEQDE